MDSARQLGLGSNSRIFSDCSGDLSTGGERVLAKFGKSEFGGFFCLRSHNQQFYGKMDVTTAFSSSNRSRTRLDGLSNGRLKCKYGGENTWWHNFENRNS